MRLGILGRYLLREATGALVAVAVVLLAIMISAQFARYLAQAAGGTLPKDLLLSVVALTSLQYLMILIPFSALLAVMLTLGRLYSDKEIAAMNGCGVGGSRLYWPFVLLAFGMALLAGAFSFQIGPWAGRQADILLKDGKWLVQFNPFETGRFKAVGDGRAVFYTDRVDEGGNQLGLVFGELQEDEGVSALTARSGRYVQEADGSRQLVLEDGWRYQGEPGKGSYDITHYDTLTSRIQLPEFVYKSEARKVRPTLDLLASSDPADRAEWHWRLASPISVFLMILIAVPLSHIAPRQGRYGKLVLGIVVYLAYSNLLTFGQTYLAKGKMPEVMGLWWIHAMAAALALALIARREGWWRR
ncbi:LPS export ABC transporter permease LptF [Solimonas sp. K1W22B-7]|uniref:LPS export ABC transporter permease LptF n=1 Tax=Solimonas sp. K1W22B-7 TaxID=2303331 RepID=UPI000E33029D|nr:LPS export ABC transporter permease LptF [Solimonas sp. K1W22B-7]AXQ29701.1 LPS export ABC transporter permease LptF [Solimonas sp. K1W22B-7]